MRIRPITESDVPELVDDLWIPFAEEMGDIDDYDALADDVDVRAEALAYREARVDDDDVQTFVAVDDGALVGYTTVSYSEAPPVFARDAVAKVKDLYVAPAVRGDGLGATLLERAHEWGREQGCARASLSVHARNDAARSVYESMGYETRYVKMDRPL